MGGAGPEVQGLREGSGGCTRRPAKGWGRFRIFREKGIRVEAGSRPDDPNVSPSHSPDSPTL